MKRKSVGLVDYASSDEEEQPTQKKRKLPTLSASLTVQTPLDDPALHQGRVRTFPHVEGQYATYIYVPLVLNSNNALYTLLEDALTLAKTHVPSLYTIRTQKPGRITATLCELHISLSRPLFLRAHQREEFKRAIRQVASSVAPFNASFTTFSELTNDERTRTFLALEIGAGHGELHHCLDLLAPTLRLLRQKEFYVDPKFHASIAWSLMANPPSSSNAASTSVTGELVDFPFSECVMPEEQARSASPREIEQPSHNFVRIPHFPRTLIPSLNEAYAAKLSQARTSGFVVDKISARIGKDVFMWPLNGIK